jgi:Fe-S-cluster containining protein
LNINEKSLAGTAVLDRFYERVDKAVIRISAIHRDRLKCGLGCANCCVDGISVFEIEAENIRSRHQDLLTTEKPHANGACAFLDQSKSCRIYADRPYVCRTQGLPLRWIEEDFDEMVEYRDICELNETNVGIVELDARDCWTIGPFEEQLALLQGPEPVRVALRDLFVDEEIESA